MFTSSGVRLVREEGLNNLLTVKTGGLTEREAFKDVRAHQARAPSKTLNKM